MTVTEQCRDAYYKRMHTMKRPSYFVMSKHDLDTLVHEAYGNGFLVNTEPHVYQFMGVNIAVRLTPHSGVELL